MILSDQDIRKHLISGKIKVDPLPDLSVALGSCSIDLRLSGSFWIFEPSRHPDIGPTRKDGVEDFMREVVVKGDEPFILQPSDFVLASTIEHISLPNDLVARLEGRSSLGRLGIVVHSTASVFEPGFTGTVVMELGNMGRLPVALYPGMRICAMTFETLSSPAKVPYSHKKSAKYMGQTSPFPPINPGS